MSKLLALLLISAFSYGTEDLSGRATLTFDIQNNKVTFSYTTTSSNMS